VIRALRKAGHSVMGIYAMLTGKAALEDLRHARDRWAESLARMDAEARRLEAILDERFGREA